MAKLFKWLIVLLIPLFSLTFTSCGDDDNDEPNGLSAVSKKFLIGTWNNGSYDIIFYEDGTFMSYSKYYSTSDAEEYRATWKLDKIDLYLSGLYYVDGEFTSEAKMRIECLYDSYTGKLILRNKGTDDDRVYIDGNFTKK